MVYFPEILILHKDHIAQDETAIQEKEISTWPGLRCKTMTTSILSGQQRLQWNWQQLILKKA